MTRRAWVAVGAARHGGRRRGRTIPWYRRHHRKWDCPGHVPGRGSPLSM